MLALLWGAFAMALIGIVMSLNYKIMNLKESMDTFINSLTLMLLASVILLLSWTLNNITKKMCLADYLVKTQGRR